MTLKNIYNQADNNKASQEKAQKKQTKGKTGRKGVETVIAETSPRTRYVSKGPFSSRNDKLTFFHFFANFFLFYLTFNIEPPC